MENVNEINKTTELQNIANGAQLTEKQLEFLELLSEKFKTIEKDVFIKHLTLLMKLYKIQINRNTEKAFLGFQQRAVLSLSKTETEQLAAFKTLVPSVIQRDLFNLKEGVLDILEVIETGKVQTDLNKEENYVKLSMKSVKVKASYIKPYDNLIDFSEQFTETNVKWVDKVRITVFLPTAMVFDKAKQYELLVSNFSGVQIHEKQGNTTETKETEATENLDVQ